MGPEGSRLDVATHGRVGLFFVLRYLTPLIALVALASRTSLEFDRERVAALLTSLVALGVALQLLAWRRPSMVRTAVWASIVADVVVLSALVHTTGGASGPLVFLFTVQAIGAGILLSAALGLRVLVLSTAAIILVDAARTGDPRSADLTSGIEAVAVLWLVGGAATLFSAFNERELKRRNTELSMVRQIALDIQNTLSIDDVLANLTRGVTKGLQFEGAAALLRNGGELRCVAASGIGGATGRSVVLRGPLERALTAGRAAAVTPGEARVDGSLSDLLGPRGYIAVPLGNEGLLVVTRSGNKGRPAKVAGNELDSLTRLAHHATVAIANARLHEHVSVLATTDALTGVANHGEFQRTLAAELGRLQRYSALRAADHRLALLLIDIDHFKQINDSFGHPAGDVILRDTASAIRSAVRSFDVVARYGGEEFAVVLPETGEEAALMVAERVRAAVAAQTPLAEQAPDVRVTVSIGVAVAPDHGATPAEIVAASDAALYRAKASGRDRVVLTSGAEPPAGDAPNAPAGATPQRPRSNGRGAPPQRPETTKRRASRPRTEPGGGPARAGARHAPERSSLPKRRIPRA